MDLVFIGVLGGYIINSILLFNRKKSWVQSFYKWYVVIGMLLISIFLLLLPSNALLDTNKKLGLWGIATPAIFSLIDYSFKRLSIFIHGRDFYLWLRGSNEIDTSKFSGGSHVKASDRVFSFGLLISFMILPFLPVIF